MADPGDPPRQQEPPEELVEDMLTIVTVFAGRLYGHRAQDTQSLANSIPDDHTEPRQC